MTPLQHSYMTPKPNPRPQIKASKAITKNITPRPRIGKSKQLGKASLNKSGFQPGNQLALGHGAPLGSSNHHNGRLVKNAFMAELAKVFKLKSRANTVAGLEAIAGKVIKLAMKSSLPAAREVFDRVDGRPAQTIIGDPDNPLVFKNVSELSDEELEVLARGHVINGTAERVD